MCERVDNPAYCGFLHPGADQRYGLTGEEKPVVAALKWFKCCYVHSKIFLADLRPPPSKINQLSQWPYRLLQRQHLLFAAGYADGVQQPFLALCPHLQYGMFTQFS